MRLFTPREALRPLRRRSVRFRRRRAQAGAGPNEAGKSTLLEFVRELLFGFAERNSYDFGLGRLEGEATMRLDSGQVVDLRRHKGRKNAVSVRMGGSETPHDAAGFNALLGNATANLFRSVFAFGLQELAAGEKGLADEGVRSAL